MIDYRLRTLRRLNVDPAQSASNNPQAIFHEFFVNLQAEFCKVRVRCQILPS